MIIKTCWLFLDYLLQIEVKWQTSYKQVLNLRSADIFIFFALEYYCLLSEPHRCIKTGVNYSMIQLPLDFQSGRRAWKKVKSKLKEKKNLVSSFTNVVREYYWWGFFQLMQQ